MERLIHFIQFLLLISIFSTIDCARMKVRMKAIFCRDVDQSVYNGSISCSLKATRDGTGYTTALYNFRKPASDFWMSIDTFYKYGTIYRSFPMMNLDVDVCAVMGSEKNFNILSIIAQHVLRGYMDQMPGFLHKCPYHHQEGFRNISVDKVVNSIYPQIIPKGEYKLLVRGHSKANVTFGVVTMMLLLDSVDPLQSMQIGRK